tara:strand:+ start:2343 stop:3038 length:696 start_codon:yes stop_codon:yes gene_type:complete
MYKPKYCPVDNVETYLGSQVTIDSNSEPSKEDVLRMIQEEETDIDYNKVWGDVKIIDEIIDVDSGYKPSMSMLGDDAFRYYLANNTIITPKYPAIIEVIKCEVNTAGDTEVPSWSERTAWPVDDSDFRVMQRQIYGKMIGESIKFYQNAPQTGTQKVRLSYRAGLNLPDTLLRTIVALRIAMRVVDIMAMNNPNINLEDGAWGAKYKKMQMLLEKKEGNLPSVSRDVTVVL